MIPSPSTRRRRAGSSATDAGSTSPTAPRRAGCDSTPLARMLQDVSDEDTTDAGFPADEPWVVRRVEMGVRCLPRVPRTVTVSTWCSGIGGRWAERRVRIRGDAGGRVDAAVVWVHLDAAGRPARLPDRFAALYAEAAGGRKVRARLHHGAVPDGLAGRPVSAAVLRLRPHGPRQQRRLVGTGRGGAGRPSRPAGAAAGHAWSTRCPSRWMRRRWCRCAKGRPASTCGSPTATAPAPPRRCAPATDGEGQPRSLVMGSLVMDSLVIALGLPDGGLAGDGLSGAGLGNERVVQVVADPSGRHLAGVAQVLEVGVGLGLGHATPRAFPEQLVREGSTTLASPSADAAVRSVSSRSAWWSLIAPHRPARSVKGCPWAGQGQGDPVERRHPVEAGEELRQRIGARHEARDVGRDGGQDVVAGEQDAVGRRVEAQVVVGVAGRVDGDPLPVGKRDDLAVDDPPAGFRSPHPPAAQAPHEPHPDATADGRLVPAATPRLLDGPGLRARWWTARRAGRRGRRRCPRQGRSRCGTRHGSPRRRRTRGAGCRRHRSGRGGCGSR